MSYGRLRKYCDFATLPWSDFIGDDQYLNVLLCEGSGRYDHEQVLLDDTILWDRVNGVNPDFDAQVAFYDPGQTVTLFPVNVTTATEVNGQQLPPGTGGQPVDNFPQPGLWIGGFIANSPGTLADTLALDFAFPAGCFLVDAAGNYQSRPVRVQAEYRPVDDAGAPIFAGWAQLFDTLVNYNTRKPQKFSNKVGVAPGRYEVRVRRYGVEAADFDPQRSGLGGSDGLVWLQLRAFLQGNASFAKETTLAIRIRATQISQGSARKFSVISTRILKVWNGNALVELPTRNPVWAFYDAATNLDYGARRAPGKIDFNAIVTLAAGADARGDQFDFEFRSPDQVPNAFDTILKATRARHRWAGDLLSAVRDELRAIPQLLLTDREIVRGSLTVNWALNSADQADAVLLEYLDQNIWAPAEVQYPPNSDSFTATNPARIRLDGVISRIQAQKHAAFFYRQALYRRTTITLDTEWEGKMLSYGSFVRVQSELPQSWGASGRIENYSDGVLTLDPAPSWEPEQTYIQIRTRRGGRFGPVKVSRFGSDHKALVNAADLAAVEVAQGMTLAIALARADDADDPSFVLGTASHTAKDCIVLQGRPNGDRVTLMMAVDDIRVHDDDIANPSEIPEPPALRDRAAPAIIMLQGNFRQGVIEPILDASWAPGSNVFYYEAQISYDDGQSWSNAYQGDQPSFSKVVDYASLQLRVRGIGPKKGAFNVISIEPPTITMRPDVIEIESFKAGLRDYVENVLSGQADTLNKIAQFIASFTAEQEAHNWLQKNETHSLLQVKSELASASIDEVRTTALATDAAFAAYQVTVNATLGDHSASITENANAIASTSSSLSSFTTTVNAHFGDLDSSVSTNATAVAGINNKLAAQWTLTLNVQGYISGMRSYNDGSAAGTIFIGDIFQIAFPGLNGGAPVPVYTVANVNGVPKIVFRGDMYADGDITARMIRAAQVQAVHLEANSVTAGKIAAGAINVSSLIADNVVITGHLQVNSVAVVSVANGGTQGFTDVAVTPRLLTSLTILVSPGGGNLLINGEMFMENNPGGLPTAQFADYRFFMSALAIYIDFAEHRRQLCPPLSFGSTTFARGGGHHVSYAINGVAPGFHQIDLYWIPSPILGSGPGTPLFIENILLTVMEAKR